MRTMERNASSWRLGVALSVLMSVAFPACTLENQSAPPFSGPSEFALAIALSASPDQLPRDGISQSVITVTVRDASGAPVAGQRLSVSSSIGTVSERNIVTGNEGRATFAFVAPASGSVGNAAVISVVPVGSDGTNAPRTVLIQLTGGSNRTAPSADFDFLPTDPETGVAVRFDASTTTDENATCLDACTYTWNFGDGSTGTGRAVSHTYTSARTYTVTLTATDSTGSAGTKAKGVTVGAVAAPSVTLVVAPNPPLEDHPATFTATGTPASGHTIVGYAWTFGDGTTQSTTSRSVSKTYSSPGTYVASVTVTDDTGQTAATSLSFTIVSSGARFTFSPTDPKVNDTVRFDAASSTGPAGATITNYEWDFGDGNSTESSEATTSHSYTAARTYVARLTVTYSNGGTGTTTQEVEIAAAD